MKLESVKLELLKPLKKNVRKHNENQIKELIKSVQQFGQTRAIVIDEDNNILIGNGLYEALIKMGETTAQCFRKTGLTEIQKKKLILSDNKTYSLGYDDCNNINDYINEIVISGDFDIPGYDEFIIKNLTATSEESEEAIQSYGIITDIKYTQSSVDENKTPVKTNEQNEGNYTNEQETLPKTPEKRYVICPSCGEVIYID